MSLMNGNESVEELVAEEEEDDEDNHGVRQDADGDDEVGEDENDDDENDDDGEDDEGSDDDSVSTTASARDRQAIWRYRHELERYTARRMRREGEQRCAAVLRRAARHLQDRQGTALDGLLVSRYRGPGAPAPPPAAGDAAGEGDEQQEEEELDGTLRDAFAYFVHELGKDECDIRWIHFDNVDWEMLSESQLRHLFGTVLPNHRTLRSIEFEEDGGNGDVLSNSVKVLASSIHSGENRGTTPPLAILRWTGGCIDRDAAHAIADMIGRNPPHLTDLEVMPSAPLGVEADDAKLLCQAVARSTTLRRLSITLNEVHADTLDGALGPSSPLRNLALRTYVDLSHEVVTRIAAHLRTNTTLESLSFYRIPFPRRLHANALEDATARFAPLLVALQKHNYTVCELYVNNPGSGGRQQVWSNQWAVRKVLSRNRRICRAMDQLLGGWAPPPSAGPCMEERRRRVVVVPATATATATAGLWPLVLEAASDVAAPLYRLFRRGAVKDVCRGRVEGRHDSHAAPSHRPKKRGRTEDDSEPSGRYS